MSKEDDSLEELIQLRDKFAMAALPGVVTALGERFFDMRDQVRDDECLRAAEIAFLIADYMLDERDAPRGD